MCNTCWKEMIGEYKVAHCRLKAYYCIDVLGKKINLFGTSRAKRSRSGPNSVNVDRSRVDNVQVILGAIGPFWPKWGLGRVPRSPSFFCLVNHATFRELRNGRFSANLVTKRSSVSRRWIQKDIFSKIFTLGVIFPKNLTSKLGQTGTTQSRLQVTGCTAEIYCLLHVVAQGPGSSQGPVNSSLRRTVAELRGVKIA